MYTREACLEPDTNYSSPVLLIGVYITAATAVLCMFLVFDITDGIRRRKPWVPCKIFSLNSLTLTLLAVATKLPVDLTTEMPGFIDQLSKLSGNTLIYVCMGLFLPSLADMEGSELLTNMASLTILVVTVIVNTCIQMSTGVIFAYFIQHFILLVLMLLILLALWYATSIKDLEIGRSNFLLKNNHMAENQDWDELERFQDYYIASYGFSPQWLLCLRAHYVSVGVLSTFSVLVIFVAFFYQTLGFVDFCKGMTDYGWSIQTICYTQILTLALGITVIFSRCFFFVRRLHDWYFSKAEKNFPYFKVLVKVHFLVWEFSNCPLLLSIPYHVFEEIVIYLLFVTPIIMALIYKVVVFSNWLVRKMFACVVKSGETYSMLKGTAEVKRWIETCKKRHVNHLIKLLSETRLSPGSSHRYEESCSCLLLVLLARIATISVPSELGGLLTNALDDVFEIIYFIDERKHSSDFKKDVKRKIARLLWSSRESSNSWFQKKIFIPLQNKFPTNAERSEFNRAIGILDEFTRLLGKYNYFLEAEDECLIIRDLIEKGRDNSVKHLSDLIQQQFLYTLHLFLPQLLGVLLDYITDSPASERDFRLRSALRFLCKFDHLKPHVHAMSVHDNITTTADTTSATNTRRSTLMEVSNGTLMEVSNSVECEDIIGNVQGTNGDAIVDIGNLIPSEVTIQGNNK